MEFDILLNKTPKLSSLAVPCRSQAECSRVKALVASGEWPGAWRVEVGLERSDEARQPSPPVKPCGRAALGVRRAVRETTARGVAGAWRGRGGMRWR